jgi:hypothetical protein
MRQMSIFGIFQDIERFFVFFLRHVSSPLPPRGDPYKYATAPSTKKKTTQQQQQNLGEILYLLICAFLLCLSWLLRSRVRNLRVEGLMNYPVYDDF